MGGYTNYIVKLSERIDWDDDEMDATLKRRYPGVEWIVLGDTPKQTMIFVVYSQTKITDIISTIRSIYNVEVEFKELEVD
uniref:Uncharacterized protein n=1 Tax=viral metagenome TaxID=1070528 RepID=A0A6C0CHZ5_9ZZZZ